MLSHARFQLNNWVSFPYATLRQITKSNLVTKLSNSAVKTKHEDERGKSFFFSLWLYLFKFYFAIYFSPSVRFLLGRVNLRTSVGDDSFSEKNKFFYVFFPLVNFRVLSLEREENLSSILSANFHLAEKIRFQI